MATSQDNNGAVTQTQNSDHQEKLELASSVDVTEKIVTPGADLKNSAVFPVRDNVDDCGFYLRNGTCKFGANCKYNHPAKKAKKVSFDIPSEKTSEGILTKTLPIECKYYLTAGGCKYGSTCKFIHTKTEPAIAVPEFNYLGFPIRMGEVECPFYMRTGTCGYGIKCKFDHPDFGFATSGYPVGQVGGYSSGNLQCEYTPFFPADLSYYSTVVSEVAGPYEGNSSSYVTSTSALPHLAAENGANQVVDNTPKDPAGSAKTGKGKQIMSSENGESLPQRPDQADCVFYLNRGACVLASDCRFHHPKQRVPQPTDIAYTKKGLALKPDGVLCHVYEAHGICKFGPTCPYDHPLAHDRKVPARGYIPPVPSVRRPVRSWQSQFGNFGEQNGY